MQKVSEFLKSRTIGFFVSAAAAVLSLVSAVLYAMFFAGEPEMSLPVFMLPFAAFLVMAASVCVSLFSPETEKYIAPYVPLALLALNLLALCLFIGGAYDFVSRLLVGHADELDNVFTFFGLGLPVCVIMMFSTALTCTVAAFTKQFARKEAVPQGVI